MRLTGKNCFRGVISLMLLSCSLGAFSQETNSRKIEAWVTNPDRSSLFMKQPETYSFSDKEEGRGLPIIIDDRQSFQSMDGFGYALTGGSAFHLKNMSDDARAKILRELFATDGNNVGISYIRLTIGASDLNSFVYSYDDLPDGKTDFDLKKFDLGEDKFAVIPVMKEILAINPDIKILASPWSAPKWMKVSNNVRGGALKPECYEVYARYLAKYVKAMEKEGIHIDALTTQNEPLNSRNTPSMPTLWNEQAIVLKNLGQIFKAEGIKTKIVAFDHNCDRPDYPLAIFNDPEVAQYVDGSAFHHYRGDINTMSAVHMARPDKNIYFTEQMVTERPGSETINIADPVKRLIIGVPRNWSKNVILWNLAADKNNDPHTDNGGCSMCQGAITIDGDNVSRNVAYYVVAHASKFARPGSVRIASTNTFDRTVELTEDEENALIKRATIIEHSNVLPNVAFKTPDGKIVLIVANDSRNTSSVRIQYNGKFANLKLAPGAVGTYIW